MTAVARTEPTALPIRSQVGEILSKDAARAAIEPMLRPGESYDRIVVEVFHAVAANPDILKCTSQSIVSAVAKAVSTGLVIGETVHLVPYVPKLQAILDYKGRIELVVRAGAARSIDAHCVYANEHFVYTQGTRPSIDHRPIMSPKARGAMVGAYAIAYLGQYRYQLVVLSTEEVDEVRQRYSKQWKQGAVPYWYAQKTCIHRLAKLLPKNPALAQVIAMFEREEQDLDDALNPADEVSAPDGPTRNVLSEFVAVPSDTPAGQMDLMPETPSRAARFILPFGRTLKGKPLGELTDQQLVDGFKWAQEQTDPEQQFPEFIEMAETLLEERRQDASKNAGSTAA